VDAVFTRSALSPHKGPLTLTWAGTVHSDGEVLAPPLRQGISAGQGPSCRGRRRSDGKETLVDKGRVRHDAEPAEDALGVPKAVIRHLVERTGLRHSHGDQ
jgi:hypothetical protein